MTWTEERIKKLRKLWGKGLTSSKIAEELTGVSRNAVIGKAHRLRLKSRPSPVKAVEVSKTTKPTQRTKAEKVARNRKARASRAIKTSTDALEEARVNPKPTSASGSQAIAAKTDSGASAAKTDSQVKAAKTDSQVKAAKTDSQAIAAKTDSGASAAKTDSKASAAKTDSKASAAKTDSKASAAKTDSKASAAKTDSKANAVKTDSKANAVKADSKAAFRAPIAKTATASLDSGAIRDKSPNKSPDKSNEATPNIPQQPMASAAAGAGKSDTSRVLSIGPGGFIRQGPGDQQAPIPPAPPRRLVPARPSPEIANKARLLDLNSRICRWPMGHPGEPDFHFCGKAVNPGFPYCVEHCGRAYQAQLPRGTRRSPQSPSFGKPRVR